MCACVCVRDVVCASFRVYLCVYSSVCAVCVWWGQVAGPAREKMIAQANTAISSLLDNVDLLLHGGALVGRPVSSPAIDPVISHVLGTDACYILTSPLGNTDDTGYANCTSYHFGAYRNSYYYAVVQLVEAGRAVLGLVPPANATFLPSNMSPEYLASVEKIRTLENPYFRNITTAMSDYMLTSLKSRTQSSLQAITTLSVLFVILFTLFVAAAYLPLIQAAGRHVRLTQAVVLLFDDKQFAELPPLKAQAKELFAQFVLDNASSPNKGLRSVAVVVLCRSLVVWLAAQWARLFPQRTPAKSRRGSVRPAARSQSPALLLRSSLSSAPSKYVT